MRNIKNTRLTSVKQLMQQIQQVVATAQTGCSFL